jgi:serine/threonine protein kinase
MANYPSRTDIVTAMKNPQVSFKAKELIGGSIIQKGSRVIQYSGGYTTVFPFKNANSRNVAIRCWIADIGEAKKRTQAIAKHLSTLNSSYFAEFNYVDDALLVNGQLHPIVVMEWVYGQTLKEYLDENIGDSGKVLAIAKNFKDMVLYFHQHDIAHGDLQHGNIIVKDDGSLAAIDYDSMFIKSLDGMPDTIKGLPGYQHPSRNKNRYGNPKLDYFSELVIYLSLLFFAEEPHQWAKYYQTEDLLFSKDDFASPNTSALIHHLLSSTNSTISNLTQKLLEELQQNDILLLRPLEEHLINKLEVTKVNIFEKWERQPDSPKSKVVSLPNAADIFNKF